MAEIGLRVARTLPVRRKLCPRSRGVLRRLRWKTRLSPFNEGPLFVTSGPIANSYPPLMRLMRCGFLVASKAPRTGPVKSKRAPSGATSIMSSTLDLAAPQSLWTPTDMSPQEDSAINFTMVFAMASFGR